MITKRTSEKGQAIVLIAFAIIGILGLVALAMDGGQAFADRRQAQNAVDSAAYASALAWLNGAVDEDDYQAAGIALLTGNGYIETNTTTRSVTGIANNADCPTGTTGMVFTANMRTIVKMWFAQIIGVGEVNNTVTAVSRVCKAPPVRTPYYPNDAVSATGFYPPACNGASDKTLLVTGNAAVNIYGGGMYSSSSDPDCVKITLSGGTGGVQLHPSPGSSPPVCAPLSMASDSGATLSGLSYVDGCTGPTQYNQAPPPPPEDIAPNPCSRFTGTTTASGSTATPGIYEGDFPPGSVTNLDPGLYCLKDNFKMAGGSLSGDGVTFVLLESGAHWTGSMTVDLKAATYEDTPANQAATAAGAIPGLLIYSPIANPSNPDISSSKGGIALEGGGSVELQGTILAVATDCRYAGNTGIPQNKMQWICNTWQATGDAPISIVYDPSVLYTPPVETTISLIK